MAAPSDVTSMALFCDFENIALGVRDAKYEKFDISKVLERLLLKGSIVVKKAYCDWERYKAFKAPMHEAAFELIEIPHVRQSGKNSADIRMVVDALDLCYTKSHVDTFVIISGDSDFSPLVSKLRENDKTVIGVGVKNSTSDLLITNCDEFIFYDDLVREKKKAPARSGAAKRPARRKAREAARPRSPPDEPRPTRRQRASRTTSAAQEALDLVVETVEALIAERGAEEKIWGSMVKQALKRRKPGFNESYYGFRSFNGMLEEAAQAGSARARARREVRRLSRPARRSRGMSAAMPDDACAAARRWSAGCAVRARLHAIAADAASPELTVTVGGRTQKLHDGRAARASGRRHHHRAAGRLVQARDDLSRRAGVGAARRTSPRDDSVRFVAADGFAATIPGGAAARDRRRRARARTSPSSRPNAPWPPLKAGAAATAGPFYLVWLRPERGRIVAGAVALPDRAHRRRRVGGGALPGARAGGERVEQRSRSATVSPCSRPTACRATR